MALNTLPNEGLTSRGYPSDRIVTPIIINGDMSVAQRGTSITGITTNTYSLDRYTTEGDDCTLTISQDTSVPTGQGFTTSLKMDVTTANSSRDAGDVQVISQRVEGQNMQMLKYGTSSAEATTLSFWCRMSQTGTYIVRLYADDGDRHICKTFTINAADTWEKKIINIPGDTAGTINNDNGRAMRVTWMLDAGTDYTSGTLATTWAAQSNANRAVGITTGWLDSTDSNFYLTGVQWEVGEFDSTSIPSFPFESFENNLRKCQRYYYRREAENTYGPGAQGMQIGSSNTMIQGYHPVKMRAAPSMSVDGTWNMEVGTTAVAWTCPSTRTSTTAFSSEQSAGNSDGSAAIVYGNNDADAAIIGDAEL